MRGATGDDDGDDGGGDGRATFVGFGRDREKGRKGDEGEIDEKTPFIRASREAEGRYRE